MLRTYFHGLLHILPNCFVPLIANAIPETRTLQMWADHISRISKEYVGFIFKNTEQPVHTSDTLATCKKPDQTNRSRKGNKTWYCVRYLGWELDPSL